MVVGYHFEVFAVFASKDEREEKQGVKSSPGYESPVGTMPHAAEQKDDESVDHDAAFGHAAASKGNIDVVAEPSGERYVPTTPEFGDIAAEIWYIEIAAQTDAEQFGAADGDIAIAREVAINLNREQDGSQEKGGAVVPIGVFENGVDIEATAVGDHHLFEKAPQHLTQTIDSQRVAEAAGLFELREEACGALDGTGNQLGEETDIGKKGNAIAGGLKRTPVDVDAIAQCLEGVERDAYRQNEMKENGVGMSS